MRSRGAMARVLGALATPSAILLGIVVGCEPQDIYLFDELRPRPSDDAGARPAPSPSDEPEPAPPAPEQPDCVSDACRACVSRDDCRAGTTSFFCHPETGACALSCDADAPDPAEVCPAPQHCEPRLGLCVDCVTDADCAGALSRCDVPRGECVECVVSDTCPIERPRCELPESRCVECLDDTDCSATGEVCLPGEQRCVQCRNDVDCRGVDEAPRCFLDQQRCVECLVDADCPPQDPDKPFCTDELECDDDRY